MARLICDNSDDKEPPLLNIIAHKSMLLARDEQPSNRSRTMTKTILSSALAASLALALAGPASAECYADYKAKRDEPLKLIYGVGQVPDSNCNIDAAAAELAPRLAADGWTLLNVLEAFGPEGLAERKATAGDYFLRY